MEQLSNADQEKAKIGYQFLLGFSKQIFESEERRESTVIEQAGRMQQAFSFVSVAILAILPLLLTWTKLSQTFVLIISSIALLGLCVCLLFATLAQWRYKREDYPTISSLHNKMMSEFASFETEAQCNKYYVEVLGKIQESLSRRTDRRIRLLKISMLVFILSLFSCICSYILSILIFS